jgi:uncharacterized protein
MSDAFAHQLRLDQISDGARIELTADEIPRIVEVRDAVVALGKQLGFTYVAVDLGGFRSGSLNPAGLVPLGRRRTGS